MSELNAQLEKEKQAQLEASRKSSATGGSGTKGAPWLEAEVQLLVKAVNLFPAGTVQR